MVAARNGDPVTWSEFDEVVRIELYSPPTNELDTRVFRLLNNALDYFDRSQARVLILSSRVPQYFAANEAPRHFTDESTSSEPTSAVLDEVCGRLVNNDRPSIAVVEGFALDAGLKLAMACTARVGSATAQLGMPKHQLDPITGAHAYEIGLLDKLADPGRTHYEALKFAAALKSPLGPAVIETLRHVDEAFRLPAVPRDGPDRAHTEYLSPFEGPGARTRLQTFLHLHRSGSDHQ